MIRVLRSTSSRFLHPSPPVIFSTCLIYSPSLTATQARLPMPSAAKAQTVNHNRKTGSRSAAFQSAVTIQP